MTKEEFDEVFAAWVSYNENGDLEFKPLEPILEHYGVSKELFLQGLGARSRALCN